MSFYIVCARRYIYILATLPRQQPTTFRRASQPPVTRPNGFAFIGKTQSDGVGGGGPGGRIGHSMVLAGNGSRVVMFGGRDNEIVRQHIPRTYEVWYVVQVHDLLRMYVFLTSVPQLCPVVYDRLGLACCTTKRVVVCARARVYSTRRTRG